MAEQQIEHPTVRYLWDWGEEGSCGPTEQFKLTQLSRTLKRGITFMPLGPIEPKRMSRDERTRMQAEILVLKEELDEAKLRGLDLYNLTVKLQADVQRLTLLNRELEAQAKDAVVDVREAREELDKRLSELAECRTEVSRLQAILPRPAPPLPSQRVLAPDWPGAASEVFGPGGTEEKKTGQE